LGARFDIQEGAKTLNRVGTGGGILQFLADQVLHGTGEPGRDLLGK
jgi:hypothetical protein